MQVFSGEPRMRARIASARSTIGTVFLKKFQDCWAHRTWQLLLVLYQSFQPESARRNLAIDIRMKLECASFLNSFSRTSLLCINTRNTQSASACGECLTGSERKSQGCHHGRKHRAASGAFC